MNSIQQDIIKLIESLKRSGVQEISFSIKFGDLSDLSDLSDSNDSNIETTRVLKTPKEEPKIPVEMTLGDL